MCRVNHCGFVFKGIADSTQSVTVTMASGDSGLQDRSAAVIARYGAARDARHSVGAGYYVHAEAVAPFAALAKLKEHLTLTPCRGAREPGRAPKGRPGAKAQAAAEEEAPFPVWTPWPADAQAGDAPEGTMPLAETRVRVPRYFGLETYGVPQAHLDDRTRGAPMGAGLRFTGVLRTDPPQVDIVASVLRVLRSPVGGAMVQVGCGKGKTVCALRIAFDLGRRTIVLVNNCKTLAPQWVSRIEQFLPGARVGIMKQKKAVIDGMDIIVASIQSLMKREYDAALMDTIGTVIVDECHHIGARVFAQCMRQFRARYTLGLSATPDRKDGLGRYVCWMLGPVVVALPTSFQHCSVIQYAWPDSAIKPYSHKPISMQLALMVNDAERDYVRSLVVLRIVMDCLKWAARTLLVLTDRVAQVNYFADWVAKAARDAHMPGADSDHFVARVHGKADAAQLDAAMGGARVIVATYAMANEALDIPRLDTLVLLTPATGFIEQIVGRIIRIHDTKRCPLVLDMADNVGLFLGMSVKRWNWYGAQRFRFLRKVQLSKAAMESARFAQELAPHVVFSDLDTRDWTPAPQEAATQDMPASPAAPTAGAACSAPAAPTTGAAGTARPARAKRARLTHHADHAQDNAGDAGGDDSADVLPEVLPEVRPAVRARITSKLDAFKRAAPS